MATTFDEQKLSSLLEGEKYDEARSYIGSLLASSQSDKADAAIDYAHAYLKAMNRVNARYLDFLKSSEATLKQIEKLQREAEDAAEAGILKADLTSRQ